MNIKQAVIAAALIGCGAATQAYADSGSSTKVMLGYCSERPGMQVAFKYDSGERVQTRDYRAQCEETRYRHEPKGHAYGWHKNHKRKTVKVSCGKCIPHKQYSRDRRHS